MESNMSGKKIIDAKNDSDGNVNAVKLEGNSSYTPINTAIKMAENGQVDAVVVKPKDGKKHLRSKPDGKKKNNLDELAK
jgi:hypothetical protein